MLRRYLQSVFATVLAFGLTSLAAAQPGSVRASAAVAYHLTRSVGLGAPDRWDYVVYDSPSHRLYVAHGLDRVPMREGGGQKTRLRWEAGPIVSAGQGRA